MSQPLKEAPLWFRAITYLVLIAVISWVFFSIGACDKKYMIIGLAQTFVHANHFV
jgi:hypothetical protein